MYVHVWREIQFECILTNLCYTFKRDISYWLQLLALTLPSFFAKVQPNFVSYFQLVLLPMLFMFGLVLCLSFYKVAWT
nr:hypothetical protein Q903MT_gene2234 [Picea sitchensis]